MKSLVRSCAVILIAGICMTAYLLEERKFAAWDTAADPQTYVIAIQYTGLTDESLHQITHAIQQMYPVFADSHRVILYKHEWKNNGFIRLSIEKECIVPHTTDVHTMKNQIATLCHAYAPQQIHDVLLIDEQGNAYK